MYLAPLAPTRTSTQPPTTHSLSSHPQPPRTLSLLLPTQEFLGEFLREQAPDLPRPVVATKFAPLPWRFTAASVTAAAKASLGRMGLSSMGLYMQHW